MPEPLWDEFKKALECENKWFKVNSKNEVESVEVEIEDKPKIRIKFDTAFLKKLHRRSIRSDTWFFRQLAEKEIREKLDHFKEKLGLKSKQDVILFLIRTMEPYIERL